MIKADGSSKTKNTLAELLLGKILERQGTFFSDSQLIEKQDEREMTRRAQDIVASYENYLSNNPKDTNAKILYGKFLHKVGQKEHAIELFLEADKLNPEIAVVKQQIANYLVEKGKPIDAFPYFILTVELEPNEPDYHFHLGNFLFLFEKELISNGILSEKSSQAFMHRSFREASTLNPGNFEFQLRYAQSFFDYEDSNKTKSLNVWKQLEKNFPERTNLEKEYLRLCHAKALIHLNRKSDAINIMQTVSSELLQEAKDILLKDNFSTPNTERKKQKDGNGKQTYLEPSYKHFLPDDPQLNRLRKLTTKLIEKRMLTELKIDAIKARYNDAGKIQIELTKIP